MTRRRDRGKRTRPEPVHRDRGGWRAHLLVFGLLMLTWIMLWGSVQPGLVLLGVVSAVAVLALFPLPHMEFRFEIHPVAALVLVARFLADVVVSSVHVAWVAVRPRPPASAVVRVPLAGTSDLVEHLTALAVSLVPGSLIIDAETGDDGRDGSGDGQRSLVIHVLDADERTVAAVTRQVLAQERRILAALGGTGERVTR